jgi:hypothetical protein
MPFPAHALMRLRGPLPARACTRCSQPSRTFSGCVVRATGRDAAHPRGLDSYHAWFVPACDVPQGVVLLLLTALPALTGGDVSAEKGWTLGLMVLMGASSWICHGKCPTT